ncbi:MAG: DUF6516 family protein [Proteobacteria bacterium]|nr:DUF6516 family protein [Pseudomonadota bacterium]
MIRKFVESIEKTTTFNAAVLSSNIQKHFGPDNDTVYLKGSILFMDSSTLDIAIFAKELHKGLSIEKYRFHYMDKQGQMLFRYDNAPHHPELSSFPDHKHIENNTIPAAPREFKDIFNEITAMILKK